MRGVPDDEPCIHRFLAGFLVAQFRRHRYILGIYGLAVVLISVVGTLIPDNMVDNLGVSLRAAAMGISVALAATFAARWAKERTLSIHAIITGRCEAFY